MSEEARRLYRLLIEAYRGSRVRRRIGYLKIRRVLGDFVGHQDQAKAKSSEGG